MGCFLCLGDRYLLCRGRVPSRSRCGTTTCRRDNSVSLTASRITHQHSISMHGGGGGNTVGGCGMGSCGGGSSRRRHLHHNMLNNMSDKMLSDRQFLSEHHHCMHHHCHRNGRGAGCGGISSGAGELTMVTNATELSSVGKPATINENDVMTSNF